MQVFQACGVDLATVRLELALNKQLQKVPVTLHPGLPLQARLLVAQQQQQAANMQQGPQQQQQQPGTQLAGSPADEDLEACAQLIQAASGFLTEEPLASLAEDLKQPGLSDAQRLQILHENVCFVKEQIAAAINLTDKVLQQLGQTGAQNSSSPQYEADPGDALNADQAMGIPCVLPAFSSRQEAVAAAKAFLGLGQQVTETKVLPTTNSRQAAVAAAKAFLAEGQHLPENEVPPTTNSRQADVAAAAKAMIGQEQEQPDTRESVESESMASLGKAWIAFQQEREDESEDDSEDWDEDQGGDGYYQQQQRGRVVGNPTTAQQQHPWRGAKAPGEMLAAANAAAKKGTQHLKNIGKPPPAARSRKQTAPPAAAASPNAVPPSSSGLNMLYGAPLMMVGPSGGFSFGMLPPSMPLGGMAPGFGGVHGGGFQAVVGSGMLGAWPGMPAEAAGNQLNLQGPAGFGSSSHFVGGAGVSITGGGGAAGAGGSVLGVGAGGSAFGAGTCRGLAAAAVKQAFPNGAGGVSPGAPTRKEGGLAVGGGGAGEAVKKGQGLLVVGGAVGVADGSKRQVVLINVNMAEGE